MNPRQAVSALCLVVVVTAGSLGCTRLTGPGGALRWKEPEPSTEKAANWELRRNPLYQPTDERRQGEPEYVWVEGNQPFYKDPPTLNRLVFGPEADLAPPDVRERLEQTRPGGPRPAGGSLETMPAVARTEPPPSGKAALPHPGVLGYVVEVRGRRLYADLTVKEGVGIGTTLVILREVGELKHPVTGRSLGQADEEIGIARVIEIRAAFSIAEIVELKPGAEVRVKDRLRTSARP
ncbi:MAG: hypothetical protein HY713_07025 [candidate division NC10 bacterium]|nr:hypothetical protein [candidate division NC10 bacterium]